MPVKGRTKPAKRPSRVVKGKATATKGKASKATAGRSPAKRGKGPRANAKAGGGDRTRAAAKPGTKLVDEATRTERTHTEGDWREATLARMRTLILEADPDMIEERKWRKPSNGMAGIPVWSHGGMVCTGEVHKNVVKLTFARGASLDDPSHLFNSSLAGGTRRAIDIQEGEKVDADAFKELVRAAVAGNAMAKER
ncbi:MAG: DUF1801 domain-containing protein [Euryarchaeota archaeon]|nr:DUF1801 domain-containing protein [Euryarchaeota archaeon]